MVDNATMSLPNHGVVTGMRAGMEVLPRNRTAVVHLAGQGLAVSKPRHERMTVKVLSVF